MMQLKILALVLLLVPGRPDEGQWLPEQFLQMDWAALQARGLALTRDQFWHPEKGGVLSAAVQINGCSATLISPDGLVVTNHHCAYGAIQRNSTLDNNILETGFVAKTRGEELPALGTVLYVVRRMEDVTARIHEAQAAARTDIERFEAVTAAQEEIVREAEAANQDTSCLVSSFLNGRKYLLYYRTRIPDVRLVYAPPRSVGEFGGEEDNWMWPRHTGDFTFLRAYVSPDGKPAPFSKENVPYTPEHWVKVSPKGVNEGDLVMILGYPGRTERYLSSVAVQSREEGLFPQRYDIYTRLIEILEASVAGDPERQLAISSQIKSLANVQKNSLGMIAGLPRNRVVEKKRREEREFSTWVGEDPVRAKRWGSTTTRKSVLDEVLELDRAAAHFETHDLVLGSMLRNTPFMAALLDLCYAAEEVAKPEGERDPQYGERQVRGRRRRFTGTGVTAALDTIEKPFMSVLMKHAFALPEEGRLGGLDAIRRPDEDAAALVTRLYAETQMLEPGARRALWDGGIAAVRASEDPAVILARGLAADLRETRQRNRTDAGRRLVVGARWIEAQEAWRGRGFYPDANSTLRVSVATVKGYAPRDGVYHVPHTTLTGVVAKERGVEPFASPAALLAAAEAPRVSRFVEPEIGDVPVCFLADGDTTGGNSGSGVLNGKGELVGLNFDRVFENIAGDFGWNAARSRNISVDIRYVLWQLESVLPAPHLLSEMGL